MHAALQGRLDAVVDGTPGVTWSVCVRGCDGGVLAETGAAVVLSTASVGKLLLLAEVARRYETGGLDPDELLDRVPELAVADSGLWQHLRAPRLCVDDLAVLVGSVSDNLATNVLLSRVGLQAVAAVGDSLGMRRTALLDRVRDRRVPGDPPRLSVGSADELSQLMADLARGALLSPRASAHLQRWLAPSADLSMVAAAFGLDPLAHVEADGGLALRNKTGTDDGVRADVGYVESPDRLVTYAAVANWQPSGPQLRDAALDGMRSVGLAIREHLGSA